MLNFFKKKKKPKNLNEVLKKQDDLEKKLAEISNKLEKLEKTAEFSVQKIGIVRYNPFSGVGSNQSFSTALLNGNNNGIIITSLYTREGNRVYGKPIEKGKSNYQLSDEEKEAIAKAKGSK
jgi:hypothetical protein